MLSWLALPYLLLFPPFIMDGFVTKDDINSARQEAEKTQTETNKVIAQSNIVDTEESTTKCQIQPFNEEEVSATKCLTSPDQHSPQILAFISFSMPEASLKALAQEASKHNAILVMRGLYEDSFVKTAQKLKDLGLSVDIHPELFDTYQVASVPTFIQIKDGRPANRLSGNVSLDFCVSKFEASL